jgi:hypothetical protein
VACGNLSQAKNLFEEAETWTWPASWTSAEMDDQDESEGATTRQQE